MGTEDLTGTKYIDDLNELWPLGLDAPSLGDQHIRGIKNVLKDSFPGITGAVTSTHTELNLIDGAVAGTAVASKALVLGASKDVDTIDVTTLEIGGVAVTSTAAELNIMDGVTSTKDELNYNDITAAGAAEASKSVVLDGSKDISGLNDVGLVGNLAISTSGKGISFAATSDAAGMTSELLDDYEEGTWTPVLSDGTNNATSSVAVGTYTKIGRMVHVKARLTVSNLGSVSGAVRITGLPYTSSSDANTFGCCNFPYAGSMALGTAGFSIGGLVEVNATYISLRLWDATSGGTDLQHSEWSATGDGIFEATYYV